jgi:hypothetical protein
MRFRRLVSTTSAPSDVHRHRWRSIEWCLCAVWLVDAALVMTHHRAGSFTSHAADLTLPAWLYVVIRSRYPSSSVAPLRLLGSAPPAAIAALVFVASTATEVSQYFWPRGLFAGTFDPLDIVAYAAGVGLCLVTDLRWPIAPLVSGTSREKTSAT